MEKTSFEIELKVTTQYGLMNRREGTCVWEWLKAGMNTFCFMKYKFIEVFQTLFS